MSLVCVYDTETTGLDTTKDYIIEIGAAIYDTNKKQVVDIYSSFLFWPDSPPIPKEVSDIHGIDDSMLMEWGQAPVVVINKLLKMMNASQYVCGHNSIGYDNKILESNMLRSIGIEVILQDNFYAMKHIDTYMDLPIPAHIKTRALKYLALEHGYVLMNAHRALSDVFACVHLLSCYDFTHISEIASTPYVTIVGDFPYENRDEAKAKGFYWNAPKKKWEKRIREYHLSDLKKQISFDLTVLNETAEIEKPRIRQEILNQHI